MTLSLSPAQMKARSQDLGHPDVLTTFTSYGEVPTHGQGEISRNLGERKGCIAGGRRSLSGDGGVACIPQGGHLNTREQERGGLCSCKAAAVRP